MKMLSNLFVVSVIVVVVTLVSVTSASDDDVFRIDIKEEQQINLQVTRMIDFVDVHTRHRPNLSFKILEHCLHYGHDDDLSSASCNPMTSEKPLFEMVDDRSGEIKQTRRIDREVLCVKQNVCYIDMKVLVLPQQSEGAGSSSSSSSDLRLFHLRVYIHDVNDNKPTFSYDVIDMKVSETSPIGHVENFNNARATDADLGENARITYTLDSDGYFELVVTESVNDDASDDDVIMQPQLGLKLLKQLDYTKSSSHRLVLHAHDNGEPIILENSITIRVKVSNENNHSPVFEQEVYNLTIGESWTPGRLLLQPKAHDGDEKSASNIQYTLSGTLTSEQQQQLTHKQEFLSTASFSTSSLDDVIPVKVRADDGWLILNRKVDYSKDDGMKILITADDGDAVNPRKGTAIIHLHVKDDNNHAPVINFNCLQTCPNNTVYIGENEEDDFTIAHVQAVDDDRNMNGKVQLQVGSLLQPNDYSSFYESKYLRIGGDGLLKTVKSFDHETEDYMDALVRACDHGTPQRRCSYQHFKLIVLDENDHAPVLHDCDVTKSVAEDAPLNSIVANIRATDGDDIGHTSYTRHSDNDDVIESRHGIITYGLRVLPLGSAVTSPVIIEPKTGIIRSIRKFDYEAKKLWKFEVTARDGGDSPDDAQTRQTSCELTIRVEDSNDNRPYFVKPSLNRTTVYASMSEHNPIFYTFKADDQDGGSRIKYSFQVKQKDNEVFRPDEFNERFLLDPITGQIEINHDHQLPPGLQVAGNYELLIRASDSKHVETLIVFVRVVDDSSMLPHNVLLGVEISPSGGSYNNNNLLTTRTQQGGGGGLLYEMSRTSFVLMVVGGCLLLIIIFVTALCLFLRHRRRHSSDHPMTSAYSPPKHHHTRRHRNRGGGNDDVIDDDDDDDDVDSYVANGEVVALQANLSRSRSPTCRSMTNLKHHQHQDSLSSTTATSSNDMKPLVYHHNHHHRNQNVDAVYNVPRQQITTCNSSMNNYVTTGYVDHGGKMEMSSPTPTSSLSPSCVEQSMMMMYPPPTLTSYDQRHHMTPSPHVVALPPPSSGERCSKACDMYGHSDTCWMPTTVATHNNNLTATNPKYHHPQQSTSYRFNNATTTTTSSLLRHHHHHNPSPHHHNNNNHAAMLDRTMLSATNGSTTTTATANKNEKTRKDSGCESVDTASSSSNNSTNYNKNKLKNSNNASPTATNNSKLPDVITKQSTTTRNSNNYANVVMRSPTPSQQQQMTTAC